MIRLLYILYFVYIYANMNVSEMQQSAAAAANFLRSLSHEGRLLILCQLVEGERSVGALADGAGLRQPAVSQQLALLRREGLVAARREGQTVYYSLADPRVARTLALLYAMFCTGGPQTY